MSVDLPEPIGAYIAAENGHDTEAVAWCFADNAVVRDEGRTIKGLAAIKQWKAETKKKYQHTVEPLESAQRWQDSGYEPGRRKFPRQPDQP